MQLQYLDLKQSETYQSVQKYMNFVKARPVDVEEMPNRKATTGSS